MAVHEIIKSKGYMKNIFFFFFFFFKGGVHEKKKKIIARGVHKMTITKKSLHVRFLICKSIGTRTRGNEISNDFKRLESGGNLYFCI